MRPAGPQCNSAAKDCFTQAGAGLTPCAPAATAHFYRAGFFSQAKVLSSAGTVKHTPVCSHRCYMHLISKSITEYLGTVSLKRLGQVGGQFRPGDRKTRVAT